MAKQYFIPRRIPDFVAHHDNLKTQAGVLVGQAGITATDVTNLNTDNTNLHTAVGDVISAEAVKQAKVATQTSVVRTVTTNEQAFANRVKTAAGYNNSIGQQLGFIGPEDSTDLTQEKPTLRATTVAVGSVAIAFNKQTSDGIRLFSKRGSETTFSFLAVDTSSPYVDTRPNLVPGTPETRQYQAQYILSDEPIGNLSDVLQVTVPG